MKKIASLSFILLTVLFSGCIKEDPPVPPAEETPREDLVPCSVVSNLTLTDRNPNGVDYYAECLVTISGGTLTIMPGVEIVFSPGAGLTVTGTGTIKAEGADTLPIRMHGTSNTPNWQGIRIETNDTRNVLSYCEISGAGTHELFNTQLAGFSYDAKAAIAVYGKLNMNHCSVTGSGGHGIAFTSEASSASFSHNTFTGNNGYPILTYAGLLSDLSLDSCKFTSNTDEYIALYSKSSNAIISEEVEINSAAIPYLGIRDLFFEGDVTINKGVTIVMNSALGMGIGNGKKMLINGTAESPVTIKGLEATAGFWNGLLVNSNNTNEFNYLHISDGGNTAYYVAEKTNMAIGSAQTARLTLNQCTSLRYAGSCAVAYSETDGTLTNNSPAITAVCTY